MLVLAAIVPVLPLWLFTSRSDFRQQAILVALGCALCCLVAIALYQRAAGGRRPFHTVAVAEFSGVARADVASASEPAAMPREIPSRRGMQWRALGACAGGFTVLVTLAALAGGAPQRTVLMQRIHDAGAEFANVRVEKVSDVQFHDPSKTPDYYTATAVVRLGRGATGRPVTATVHTDTPDRPVPGSRVSVLYAPAQPHLGALAGDERSLGAVLHGNTMSTMGTWASMTAWILGMGFSVRVVWELYGFRSFSRLGRDDKAVRAKVLGPDFWREGSKKEQCLKILTPSSRVAHFLINVTDRDLPDSLNGQQLWLCWDAHRGSGGKRFSPKSTPAALVSDDGWVMHGMLKSRDAKLLADEGVPVEKAHAGMAHVEETADVATAGVEETAGPEKTVKIVKTVPEQAVAEAKAATRTLRLWDPRSAWPLFIRPSALAPAALLIACGALLTCDIPVFWRWTTAIAGVVVGLAVALLSTIHQPLRPAKENAR
ncbi:hypothetical protein RM550_33800 [Streptomyces sp. DSM 41527]|uniref:DUF3592 domain-containing protein n=1 Tax=Streptomyces mooreae TaxID=3075523 RepID=A0ABU2TI86_9ACTN|nr:hypothetical protein [Streptomyces sp. DSM 41527]MDT0460644.1 hypothetical protein [Streptomyces sp. DSM 41527]